MHLSESGASEVRLQITNSNTSHTVSDGFAIVLDAAATNQYFWNYEARNMLFATDNSTRMTIDSTGNVHVGADNFTFDGTDIPTLFSVKGTGSNGGTAIKTFYVAIGNSTSAYDTGLPIDTGGPGASALMVVKGNYGAGALTSCGLYLINFHMSGVSTPTLIHVGGDTFGTVTAGNSGSDTLTLKIGTGHNVLYQMFLFSY